MGFDQPPRPEAVSTVSDDQKRVIEREVECCDDEVSSSASFPFRNSPSCATHLTYCNVFCWNVAGHQSLRADHSDCDQTCSCCHPLNRTSQNGSGFESKLYLAVRPRHVQFYTRCLNVFPRLSTSLYHHSAHAYIHSEGVFGRSVVSAFRGKLPCSSGSYCAAFSVIRHLRGATMPLCWVMRNPP